MAHEANRIIKQATDAALALPQDRPSQGTLNDRAMVALLDKLHALVTDYLDARDGRLNADGKVAGVDQMTAIARVLAANPQLHAAIEAQAAQDPLYKNKDVGAASVAITETITGLARAMQKAHPELELTIEQAESRVLKERPEIYRAYAAARSVNATREERFGGTVAALAKILSPNAREGMELVQKHFPLTYTAYHANAA